jgi:hypothetical protein
VCRRRAVLVRDATIGPAGGDECVVEIADFPRGAARFASVAIRSALRTAKDLVLGVLDAEQRRRAIGVHET